ncbi:MAG: hydroxyethylthiazole kinase [Fusobacterium sp.]
MEEKLLGNIIEKIREKNPIIFHITNLVTINDCANITLALGASPLMSFCEEELEDIFSFSSALVLNIGTMDKSMRKMAVKAGKVANKLGKPVILDPVGAGASKARMDLVTKLIKNVNFAVIKGNMAEIKSIAGIKNENNKGVDSIEEFENADDIAINLAKRLNTVIALTGKEDIVTDGKRIAKINNGTPILGKVTGTGCMTASLIGSTCAVEEDYFLGATVGVSIMGISGEIAESRLIEGQGNSSLRVWIIDSVYNMTSETFNFKNQIELNL